MLFQSAFKWLTIFVIVLSFFLAVLLGLGYLLKENKAITTKLKAQLEQAANEEQAKEQRKQQPFATLKTSLSSHEKSQKKIINDNLSCTTAKQCFLVHTNSPALGCIVVVNTTGAAILLKIATQDDSHQATSNACQQEYQQQQLLTTVCRDNNCAIQQK